MEIDETKICHYRKSSGGSVKHTLQRNQPLLLRKASSRRIPSLVFAPLSSGAKLVKTEKPSFQRVGATLNNPLQETFAKSANAHELNR